MNSARYIFVPMPSDSSLAVRTIVTFAVMTAVAVLVMIAVIIMFPGPRDGAPATTGVSTTQHPAQMLSCYPFGGCGGAPARAMP